MTRNNNNTATGTSRLGAAGSPARPLLANPGTRRRTARRPAPSGRRSRIPPLAWTLALALLALLPSALAQKEKVPWLRGPALKDPVPGYKIVGGTVVSSPSKYPWMATLRHSSGVLCGGSMIAPKIAMTAAHCTTGREATGWTVQTYRLNLYTDTQQDIIYQSVKLYQHPNYNSNTMENDIALLILGDPASSDGTYVPQFIQVNRDPAYPVVNQTVTAAGWGTTSSGGSISQNLLEVNLQAISTQHCMTFVGAYGSYGSEANYATGICAGTGNGTDTCQGDSGGPLFASRNGVYVQVGITSWGWGCATYPGLYSRVSALSGWIDGVVNGEGGYAGQTSQSTKTATTTRTQTPVTTTTQTTQTFSTTTICATSEAQIPDLNFASSQVLVPADFPAVQHINVIVTFNHTYPRDMTASLLRTSDDRSIRLFSRMACTSPHAWTMTFDDHAEISTFDCSAWDDQPTIRPLDALSTFSGANAAGAWKLTMRDELPADAGYLTSWCMVLSGTPGEYPTTKTATRTRTSTTKTCAAATEFVTVTRTVTTASPYPVTIRTTATVYIQTTATRIVYRTNTLYIPRYTTRTRYITRTVYVKKRIGTVATQPTNTKMAAK